MKKLLQLALYLGLGFCTAKGSYSYAASQSRERTFESLRSFGRGGTFVAAFPSDESVMMNPANLGEKHNVTFQARWMQLDGFWGKNTQDTLSDILEIEPGSASPVGILQSFNEKFGKQQYLRFQSTFGVRILNFDFAPFFTTSNWLDLRIPTTPEVDIHSDTLAGANMSFGLEFGKSFYLGTTLRPFFRNLFTTDLTFAEILEFEPLGNAKPEDIFINQSGSGLAADLGAIYYIGKATRLGLLIEDIGYTGYSFSSGEKLPPPIPTFVTAGFLTRYDFKPWRLDWSLDMRDILNPEGLNVLRMLRTGVELGRSYRTLDNDLGVSLGLNEGYITFGTFMDFYIFRFDVVSYGVELGEYPGQRQDRRIAASLRTNLTF